MSTVQKLSQLSHRIFNTSVSEKSVVRSSNPFAASNFQKNILTEDVFESSKPKINNKMNLTENLTASSKRIYSTFVGSINDFGTRFYEGVESIKAFCGKMKNGIVNTWNKLQEIGNTEVKVPDMSGAKEVLGRDITSFFVNRHDREVSKMAKMDPHTEVKPMFTEALASLEADMAA